MLNEVAFMFRTAWQGQQLNRKLWKWHDRLAEFTFCVFSNTSSFTAAINDYIKYERSRLSASKSLMAVPPSIESRRISASRIHNRKLPRETRKNCLMDMNTKTTGTKTGVPQAFREMTEKGTTHAKETYEKMSVASTEAADLIQNSYLTAVKGVQDYNNKFFEFAHENTNAAFDFIQKMSGVRSPSAFIELSTEHARKQLESLTEQAKELATIAQKATLATTEPLKTASKR